MEGFELRFSLFFIVLKAYLNNLVGSAILSKVVLTPKDSRASELASNLPLL